MGRRGRAHSLLFQLRKQVDDALLSVDGGLDVRHFRPHFTLGRLGENHKPKELEKFLARHKNFKGPPFRVSEFHLMASLLHPGTEGQGLAPFYRSVQAFILHLE